MTVAKPPRWGRTSSRVTSRHLNLSNVLPRSLSDACLLTASSEPPVLPTGRHPTTLNDSWRCPVGKQMFADTVGSGPETALPTR
jgi:hypothetical protein